jgi:hypothetical protein
LERLFEKNVKIFAISAVLLMLFSFGSFKFCHKRALNGKFNVNESFHLLNLSFVKSGYFSANVCVFSLLISEANDAFFAIFGFHLKS